MRECALYVMNQQTTVLTQTICTTATKIAKRHHHTRPHQTQHKRTSAIHLFFLMIRRPPRPTPSRSSAASDVYNTPHITHRPHTRTHHTSHIKNHTSTRQQQTSHTTHRQHTTHITHHTSHITHPPHTPTNPHSTIHISNPTKQPETPIAVFSHTQKKNTP